jgi:hypothetical protein
MNATVIKFAPTAVALAVAGYVVWPYADLLGTAQGPPETAVAPKDKDPKAKGGFEVPRAMLGPELVPPPVRDPFDDPEERRGQARATINAWLKDLKKSLDGSRNVRSGRPGPRRQGKGTAPDDPLDSLTLNATYIQEGKAAALINGRLCRPGQPIEAGGEPRAFVLREVRLHSVVLRNSGCDLELTYGPRHAPEPDGQDGEPAGVTAGVKPKAAASKPASRPVAKPKAPAQPAQRSGRRR